MLLLFVTRTELAARNFKRILFRWIERRSQRVPNKLGSLPADPLSIGQLCTNHIRREGLPRTTAHKRDNNCCVWALQSNGEVRPSHWQVHGLLLVVSRRCSAWWCKCLYCQDSQHALRAVRGLVSYWLQGRHQPSTSYRCARFVFEL